ncbi:YdcH family protein [Roseicyclus sp.]|uniref:YdcH family protein n=1 Tax=Roseicyclus sp. TaxID=1914329 RepID=UPI003F6B8D5B
MNAPSGPTAMNHEDVLRVRLEVLKRQHRDLDIAIEALHAAVNPDQLTLKRLKKQKLMLKDQIARIEDELIPDILA